MDAGRDESLAANPPGPSVRLRFPAGRDGLQV